MGHLQGNGEKEAQPREVLQGEAAGINILEKSPSSSHPSVPNVNIPL